MTTAKTPTMKQIKARIGFSHKFVFEQIAAGNYVSPNGRYAQVVATMVRWSAICWVAEWAAWVVTPFGQRIVAEVR